MSTAADYNQTNKLIRQPHIWTVNIAAHSIGGSSTTQMENMEKGNEIESNKRSDQLTNRNNLQLKFQWKKNQINKIIKFNGNEENFAHHLRYSTLVLGFNKTEILTGNK